MKILVTGAAGFSGKGMLKRLKTADEAELYLADIVKPDGDRSYACDLGDEKACRKLIADIQPDQVYHLAGTFTNDYETDYRANVLSTRNLFDSVLAAGLKTRLLLIGSAAEYGLVDPADNPVSENNPSVPVSIYGLTKVYQTGLMHYYAARHDLDVRMARVFNLLGRGLSNRLFAGRLYEQIDQYKAGKIRQIELGNLESTRDFLEVDKACDHYMTIMNRGLSGEIYNVGSGNGIRIRELLARILAENGLSDDVVISDKKYFSKLDAEKVVADISRLLHLYDQTGS